MRLRDGESNMLAGLLRDEDRKALQVVAGSDEHSDHPLAFRQQRHARSTQTDIVMIITPHIVRSHELTPADLKPIYIGTGHEPRRLSSTPSLISPDATFDAGNAAAAGLPAAGAPPANIPGAPVTGNGARRAADRPAAPATATRPRRIPPRAPGVVPIAPVQDPTTRASAGVRPRSSRSPRHRSR